LLDAHLLEVEKGNVEEMFGVRDFAELLHIHPTHLSNTIKHVTGRSPCDVFEERLEAAFDQMLNIHFKGVYLLTQQSLPMMNDGGRIINISSGTTRFCVPGYSLYSSMKAGIEMFTKYLAKEIGARGMTANVLAPGAIETDFNGAAIRNNPQMKGYLASQTALGCVGEANDIGGIVAFLCSPEAGWINGQRIEASGGIFL
jgi:NAD(P)-dependent dehydrogenase (short-subunit alcohol dehydrogenase family)